jgi:N4-gp56 family major capsid protein
MAGEMIYGNGTTTATTGANTVTHHYDRAGVKAATADLIYSAFADSKSMPQKYGKTFKISMFQQILDGAGVLDKGLDASGNPTYGNLYGSSRDLGDITAGLPVLGEGASEVNRVVVTKKTGEVTFNRFGLHLAYTDEIDLFSEDRTQMIYREMLGDAAAQVNEDLIQRDMLSGTNVFYVGSATSRITVGADTTDVAGADDADSLISYDDTRKIVATLVSNRAKKFTSIITGSTKIDTKTINASYVGIIGPEVKFDLQGVADTFSRPAWIPVNQYGSAATLMPHEVGAINELRFVETERAQKFVAKGAVVPTSYTGTLANGTVAATGGGYTAGEVRFNVYPILCPTQGAFATVGLQGWGKMKFNAKAPGQVSDTDKYGTRGFFSVNWFYAGIILDESKLLRVETAATDIGIGAYGSGGINTNGPKTM